jgi:hypothetical protein
MAIGFAWSLRAVGEFEEPGYGRKDVDEHDTFAPDKLTTVCARCTC